MKKRISLGLLFIATVLGSFASAVHAQSGTLLRWKLNEGDKFEMNIANQVNQVIDPDGQNIEIPMSMNFKVGMTVDKAGDAKFETTQTMQQIRIQSDSPFMSVDFDSSKKEDMKSAEGLAGVFKSLVGKSFKQTLSDRGESLNFEVDPKLMEEVQQNEIAARFFNEDSLKQMLTRTCGILPEKAVNEGATWEDSFDQTMKGMKMTIKSKYTYAGKVNQDGQDLDKFTVKSDVSISVPDDAPFKSKLSRRITTARFFLTTPQADYIQRR